MPLTWEVSHDDRLVTIAGTGDVVLKDVETYLDDIVVKGAMSYAKLFDTTRLVPVHDDHDVMMLGARMSAYAGTMKGSALAFVVANETMLTTVERYMNVAANSERPIAVFTDRATALAWLKTQKGSA